MPDAERHLVYGALDPNIEEEFESILMEDSGEEVSESVENIIHRVQSDNKIDSVDLLAQLARGAAASKAAAVSGSAAGSAGASPSNIPPPVSPIRQPSSAQMSSPSASSSSFISAQAAGSPFRPLNQDGVEDVVNRTYFKVRFFCAVCLSVLFAKMFPHVSFNMCHSTVRAGLLRPQRCLQGPVGKGQNSLRIRLWPRWVVCTLA